jgi:Spy/CpxP family protein refolding chaperone
MRHLSLLAGALMSLTAATVYADDPPQPQAMQQPQPAQPAPAAEVPQPPRTHVDTTVVGDARQDGDASSTSKDSTAPQNLDNDHRFVPGAPDILKVTRQLNLSPEQTAKVHDVIENADAGAAVLIKHEQDEKQMIAATTPADPMYAKLIAHQANDASLWTENRESLKRDVLNVLTPAQRSRFEELQAHN